MNQIEFYDRLSDKPPETMEIKGKVLMNKNSSKWHVCKKKAASIGHACGSGIPINPNNTSSFHTKGSHISHFEKETSVVGVKESLEYDRMCKNCMRIIQDEFDLERMIIAVPADPSPDATKGLIERFVRKLPDPKS